MPVGTVYLFILSLHTPQSSSQISTLLFSNPNFGSIFANERRWPISSTTRIKSTLFNLCFRLILTLFSHPQLVLHDGLFLSKAYSLIKIFYELPLAPCLLVFHLFYVPLYGRRPIGNNEEGTHTTSLSSSRYPKAFIGAKARHLETSIKRHTVTSYTDVFC